MVNDREIYRYTLKNDRGISVSIINYGGIVTDLWVPGFDGKPVDVVLGFDSLEEYVSDTAYIGALVGRFANRIREGKFVLEGEEYTLNRNERGKHHIHGGFHGFNRVIWGAREWKDDYICGLRLEYLSRDGEEGYPGNLSVKVSYILTERNEFVIEYLAETDRPTPVNLTNHTYWNLNGRDNGKIYNHILELRCASYLEVDKDLIPTGEITPVDGTPMDFRLPRGIGFGINRLREGYDHCYLISSYTGGLIPFARVFSPVTGISMRVSTTMPGVQFYSGNFLRGRFEKHSGFCLETEFYPDSPNRSEFPSCVLRPGNLYRHVTIHSFE